MNRAHFYRILAMTGLATLFAVPHYAAATRRLTLTQAVHLAIEQNRALKIARLKVIENQQKNWREVKPVDFAEQYALVRQVRR